LRDQIFVIDVGGFIRNLGQALIAKAVFDFGELLIIKLDDVVFAREEAVVLRDVLGEFVCVLVFELVLLKALEFTAEGHRQDGVGLILGETKAFIQLGGRFFIGLANRG
jgi:hypothetical protein